MFTKLKAVKVQEIIMSGSAQTVGTIRYKDLAEGIPLDNSRLGTARPLFYNISQYPTINEVVYIVAGPKNTFNGDGGIRHYYFPPLNIYGSANNNAQPSELTLDEDGQESSTGASPFFQENETIKSIQPYGGDITIEGRYGNSIRFGSTTPSESISNNWSNEGDIGNPITIIRNGQPDNEDTNVYNDKYINL